MKIYKANRKGLIRYLLALFLILPVGIFLLDTEAFSGKPFILLLSITPAILIVWMYLDTWYKIENGRLKYKSAFLKGEIVVETIREITRNTTMWSGLKPALARNGIIIRYNKYDEIYLAPEDNDELIPDLLDLNASIKITDKLSAKV